MSLTLLREASPREARPATALIRRLRPLGMEGAHAVALLLVSVALAGWCAAVGQALSAGGLVFSLLYPLCAYYTGRLVRSAVGVEPLLGESFAFLFLSGCLGLPLLQFAVHSCLAAPLTWQFMGIVALVAVGQFLRPKDEPPARSADPWAAVYLTAFCLAAATCWARGLFQSVHPEGEEVVFRNWRDFFVHASVIARFTTGTSLWAQGNWEIAGLPALFVHYASYLPAATQAGFTGQWAYEAALCTWVPLGTFLTGLAAYVLVLPWAGRPGGLCAAVSLLTLPDPSCSWPSNGFLAYHWLQQIAAAGTYGVACAALALTLLLQWRRARSRSALLVGLAFGAATLLYKAQVFVVLVPLLGACLALWLPGASRPRRLALFAGWLAVCAAAAVLLNRLHPSPRPFGLDRASLEGYGRVLAANLPDSHWRRKLEAGFAGSSTGKYYARLLGAWALGTAGVWLVLGLALAALALVRRRLSAGDAPPWLALGIFLFLAACFDDAILVGQRRGEVIHRPLVWVYFLLCTWCAASVARLLPWRRRTSTVAAVLAVPFLLWPYRMGWGVQEGTSVNRFDGANVRASRGLVEAARFIARSGKRTDVIQDSVADNILLVGGLAERRSYLARPGEWRLDGSALLREEVRRRIAEVESLRGQTTREDLFRAAQRCGIRWFVLHPGDAVRWPAAVLQASAFTSQDYRVFDLAHLPE